MSNQSPTIPLFQILFKGPRQNRTVTLPTGLTCSAGTAFMDATPAADQDASGNVVVADGSKLFRGFVTRDVITSVPTPTFSELSTAGDRPNIPFESQFQAGFEGTLEDANEFEAEGPFLSSGNGAKDINAATAVGTPCSFVNGVVCVAATGQYAEFLLAEQQTPSIAGNVRCRFEKQYGIIKGTAE